MSRPEATSAPVRGTEVTAMTAMAACDGRHCYVAHRRSPRSAVPLRRIEGPAGGWDRSMVEQPSWCTPTGARRKLLTTTLRGLPAGLRSRPARRRAWSVRRHTRSAAASFASLLLHEGRRVIYVARQFAHDARLTLSRYGHVITSPRTSRASANKQSGRRGRGFPLSSPRAQRRPQAPTPTHDETPANSRVPFQWS
jgi:hypothetical protein